MNSNEIIKEISFLYELALSVGRSLDKRDNSKQFLHTLMSGKNMEFGGVWIRNYNIPYSEEKSGYSVVYANPLIRLSKNVIPDSKFLDDCFEEHFSFSQVITEEICNAIGFKAKREGAITFFKLQELGFMVLYSSSSKRIWNEIEQNKLRNVLDKFSISLKACLFHQKSIQDLITISKTQQELENAKKKAEEASELKSAFLSNISHEIRTPINAIVGFSNLLSDEDINEEQLVGFVQHIKQNSKKLLKLISNLIDVSKIHSKQLNVKKEDFNLDLLLLELVQKYKKQAKDNDKLTIELVLPENLANYFINADKSKVIQVFDNLFENSLKFTPEGQIRIGYFFDDNMHPVFFIKDSGVGIPESIKEFIFEIFRQGENNLKRKFGGSGIGLTLCKNLIELMDGKIWFESKENVGSNFYFRLSGSGQVTTNLLNVPHNEIIKKTKSAECIEYPQRNILIAEDVKSNFEYLNAIIELTDAKVIWAKNGKDAIEICNRNNPKIDLVLMDIRMPETGGLEAIKQIKENNNIPVVVQTAFSMNNEKQDCYMAGADDFILKPINPQKLIEILQRYL